MTDFRDFNYDDELDVPELQLAEPEDLMALLNELVDTLRDAPAIPFSTTARVPREYVLDLANRVARALPVALREAEALNRDADRIRSEAARHAAMITDTAQREAAVMVDREEVVHRARQKAAEIMADAEARISQRSNEANEYLQQVLTRFDEQLDKMHKQAIAHREKLKNEPNPFSIPSIAEPNVAVASTLPPPSLPATSPGFVISSASDSFYDPDDL